MINWLTLYHNLPISMKKYLKTKLGLLSDFDFESRYSNSTLFISRTTKIEVSFSLEPDGLLVAIWFPDAKDPTYTEHQTFIQNLHCDLLAN